MIISKKSRINIFAALISLKYQSRQAHERMTYFFWVFGLPKVNRCLKMNKMPLFTENTICNLLLFVYSISRIMTKLEHHGLRQRKCLAKSWFSFLKITAPYKSFLYSPPTALVLKGNYFLLFIIGKCTFGHVSVLFRVT